jgi:hypothetical protein
MVSLGIGWEIPGIVSGKGANLVVPLLNDITVTGLQLSISAGFPNPAGGFFEVFCEGLFVSGPPTFANVPPGAQQYPTGPGFSFVSDWGQAHFDDPNNLKPGGGASEGMSLFNAILKTDAPTATQQNIDLSDLSMSIPAGSYLVLHMDSAGQTADVEMQGVLFYDSVKVARRP